MKEKLYWHFRANQWSYRFALIILSCVGLLLWSIGAMNDRKESQRNEVLSWVLVEAVIVDSQISYRDTSNEAGHSGQYHARLQVVYDCPETGVEHRASVLGHWGSFQDVGGKQQFQVGRKVTLRVNPEDPKRLSLIDITGTI